MPPSVPFTFPSRLHRDYSSAGDLGDLSVMLPGFLRLPLWFAGYLFQQPFGLTPFPFEEPPQLSAAVQVERCGSWHGRVQVAATGAEGYRLDAGDFVLLLHHRNGVRTRVVALTCGSWEHDARWVRHLMCNWASHRDLFYLLVPRPWSLRPNPLHDLATFTVVANFGRERIPPRCTGHPVRHLALDPGEPLSRTGDGRVLAFVTGALRCVLFRSARLLFAYTFVPVLRPPFCRDFPVLLPHGSVCSFVYRSFVASVGSFPQCPAPAVLLY